MKKKKNLNCDVFKKIANWLRKSNNILKLCTSFLVLQNFMDKFNRRLTIGLAYHNVTLLILNLLCPSLSPQNSTFFQLGFWAIVLVIIFFYLNCNFFYCFNVQLNAWIWFCSIALNHFTCFVILLHSKTFSLKSLYIIMWNLI
jgi:hypothetical protein